MNEPVPAPVADASDNKFTAPEAPPAAAVPPVAKTPNPKCKKCYGRGHIGKDVVHGGNIKCHCVYTDEENKIRQQRIQDKDLRHRFSGNIGR